MKKVIKTLLLSACALALASCSIKNIESEPGAIMAGIDRHHLWTVVKAESAMYQPFMDVGNKHGSFDGTRDKNAVMLDLAASWLTVQAQDLVLACDNQTLEVNQPIFSDYGKVEVGDKGIVVYVRWDSVQNNVFVSNKKHHPRFIPAKALNQH